MGLETVEEDETDEFAPVRCPRCDKETPRSESRCVWCGQALSPAAAQEAAEQDRDMMQAIADNPEFAETLMDLKELSEEVPGMRIAFDTD